MQASTSENSEMSARVKSLEENMSKVQEELVSGCLLNTKRSVESHQMQT